MITSQDQTDPACLLVLYARDAELVGRRYTLGPSPRVTTVGRSSESTIMVRSDSVSRRHARFEERAGGWWVIDDGSCNGTFVNDERVQEALLRRGDRVQVGDVILKFGEADDVRGIVETEYSPTPIDGLTQAYNRRHLVEQIDGELQDAGRTGRALALVLFDLDHFNKVNYTDGHPAGDQVLREIALLLRRHVRPGDVLARYAGDEFALLLPGTDLQGAAALAHEIRTEIAARAFTFDGRTISITVSAGVAQANEGTRTADDLLRSARQRLDAARIGGR